MSEVQGRFTRQSLIKSVSVLETEEQTLGREQNERDVLGTVGHYKCPPGISLEDVSNLPFAHVSRVSCW
jgi:hypothetical protein